MRLIRCLFKNDPHYPVDPSKEPEVFLADAETVSMLAEAVFGPRVRIGFASPAHGEYERRAIADHPDCVWVTTNIAPVQIVEPTSEKGGAHKAG